MDEGMLTMIMNALQQHQAQQAQQTPMFTEMGQDVPMMPNEGGGAGGPYDDDYNDPRFSGTPLQPDQDPLTGQQMGAGGPYDDDYNDPRFDPGAGAQDPMTLQQEPGQMWGPKPQQGGSLEAMFGPSPAAGGRMSTK